MIVVQRCNSSMLISYVVVPVVVQQQQSILLVYAITSIMLKLYICNVIIDVAHEACLLHALLYVLHYCLYHIMCTSTLALYYNMVFRASWKCPPRQRSERYTKFAQEVLSTKYDTAVVVSSPSNLR